MKHTKEQLEGMSDLQISFAVAVSLRSEACVHMLGDMVMMWSGNMKDDSSKAGCYGTFDINNPSDMMPLVFESRITIATCPATDCWVAVSENMKHNFEDDNPLRAAAIVYLLMRGE